MPVLPLQQTASWLHRLGALMVDWLACTFVVLGVMGPADWSNSPWSGLYVTGVFVLESAVLTSLAGGSFGKLLTRLRVVRQADGGPVDLLRSVARAVLLALVIPPLVFRPDGRGLHDMVAGSVTVRLADLRS